MMTRSNMAAVGAAGLTLFSAGAVAAADLGPARRGPPPRPIYDAPPPNYSDERWSGLYIGAGLGYSSGTVGVDGASGVFDLDQSGANGTLFAGYNWQFGSTVAGIEADIGTGNLGGSVTNFGSTVKPEVNVLGSLRGRLGILATPQTLLYATAGLAWADYEFKVSGANTVSDTLYGYQVGAGLEYAIAPQWTMRLEYNYTDLGSARIDQGPVINTYTPEFHTIRAGVAFKF